MAKQNQEVGSELNDVEIKKIRDNIESLNGLIKPYQLAWVNVDEDCVLLEKNARFMVKSQLDQLTENIKKDGFLSQLPFGILEETGKYKIISGNHRIKASRKAGIKYILILYLKREDVTKDKELGIQISHNEISGQDDLGILRELYMEIESLDMKQYTGVDEVSIMKYEPVSILNISDQEIPMNEVKLIFTDRNLNRVEDVIEKLNSLPSKDNDMFSMVDFDRFIEAMTEIKLKSNIKNTTIAFIRMIEICEEWIKTENEKIDQESE